MYQKYQFDTGFCFAFCCCVYFDVSPNRLARHYHGKQIILQQLGGNNQFRGCPTTKRHFNILAAGRFNLSSSYVAQCPRKLSANDGGAVPVNELHSAE